MIHLTRLPEPKILVYRAAQWLYAFKASGKDRPPNSQYAHQNIRNDLNSISHNKCFYCERELKGLSKEIDHDIEVKFDKDLSFIWSNLYLSCSNCNDKIPHSSIPVNKVLNPFQHTNNEIEEHITFEKESIRIKNNSELGKLTIQKYRLDSETLDLIRSKYLTMFYEEYCTLKDKCLKEGRANLSQIEKEQLTRYSYEDHPFSLMFKIILRKKGIDLTDAHMQQG